MALIINWASMTQISSQHQSRNIFFVQVSHLWPEATAAQWKNLFHVHKENFSRGTWNFRRVSPLKHTRARTYTHFKSKSVISLFRVNLFELDQMRPSTRSMHALFLNKEVCKPSKNELSVVWWEVSTFVSTLTTLQSHAGTRELTVLLLYTWKVRFADVTFCFWAIMLEKRCKEEYEWKDHLDGWWFQSAAAHTQWLASAQTRVNWTHVLVWTRLGKISTE